MLLCDLANSVAVDCGRLNCSIDPRRQTHESLRELEEFPQLENYRE